MSIKAKDLSAEIGVPVADILEQLQKLFVDVEDGGTVIDDTIADLVRVKLGGFAKQEEEKKKKAAAKAKAKKITQKKAEKKAEKEEKKKAEKEEKNKDEKDKEGSEEKKIKPGSEKDEEPKDKQTDEGVKEEEKTVAPSETKEKATITPKPAIEIVQRTKEVYEHKKATGALEAGGGDRFRGKKPRFKKKSIKPLKKLPIVEMAGDASKPGYKKSSKFSKAKPVLKKGASKDEIKSAGRKAPQKVMIEMPVTVRTLAPRINKKPNDILQYLMDKGLFASINQDLEEDLARDIVLNFGYELELPDTIESIEKELVDESKDAGKIVQEKRAPIVTFMGHVDHGKTSLLDYIRDTMVASGEKGGITQHIGAYKVKTAKGAVTFLDTPGHAAFTAMRARGANVTDVVVLVVAADDGVMPQTKEAIDHAKVADVPIVVAINKCDLPGANPDRVKTELQKEGIMSEDFGGNTVMVEVSAKTGEGVDDLVDMLMLESELLELKASPKIKARGFVIESKKTSGQGIVATFLVMNGTLNENDIVITGKHYGKVKAMSNELGVKLESAGPATPVEVLGLLGVPEAGEEFFIVKDEKKAKTLASLKQQDRRDKRISGRKLVTLEDFHQRMQEDRIKELKIVLKADVQGSVEAISNSLEELSSSEVKVSLIHSAVGNINESDVMLSVVSDAVILGFHVKVDTQAEKLSKSETVDIHLYDVIYEAVADVKASMEGLLEPEEREVMQGRAQVRQIFSSKSGNAAGCMIIKGTVHRKDRIKVIRGSEVIFTGDINALKRFKDDVKEAKEGFECGITIRGFNNVKQNDVLEAFIIEKVARRLESKKS